nr:M48 family metalloprotease [Pseudonocardiales bacterium]
MIVTVYLPLLATLPLAWLAPMLGRRCAPAVAARLLTFLAGLAALVTLGALGLLMIGATLRRPELSREVATQIADGDSVPAWLGALASVGLAAGLIRLGRILARQRHAAQALHHAIAAHTPGSDQELVVVPDSACHAFAVPGRCGGRGRIVVSTAMLRALDASERRALLAHERAHLRHRHHRHALLLAAAQAVNPLLARLRAEGEFQIERWADEHSAHTTSRPIAARSLAAAALHPGDGRD